jgi:tRNA(Ile2) C34 agmatinyltransferase TiaS
MRKIRNEQILDQICNYCGKNLYSDGKEIYCKTENCEFKPDNLLEYWLMEHNTNDGPII